MFSVDHGFYGGHGIVGAQVPLGTGLAFKHKYAEDGGVCLTYFGDGAVNQGQVYESLQHGQAVEPADHLRDREQPICDGHDRSSARRPSRALPARRGASAFPGFQVDGMDVLAVRGAAEVALEWARGGKGPIILEFMTYRYRGHSMSDPAKYRTREEVQDVREHRDPIDACRARARGDGRQGRGAQGDRQGNQGHRRRSCRSSPKMRPSPSRPSSTPTFWWGATDADSSSRCPLCPRRWRRGRSPNGWSRKATTSSRATSSPRSRPTRRRWSSRRSTRARSRRSSCPRAPTG